jgi:hypothetical protein
LSKPAKALVECHLAGLLGIQNGTQTTTNTVPPFDFLKKVSGGRGALRWKTEVPH